MAGEFNNFCLDGVFKEKTDYVEYTFDVYKKIYNLPVIKYSGNVSKELFEYCLKRKFFILLAIYDQEGEIYLERNFQEKLYWSLPGGSVLKNEDVHSAIRRISGEITEDGKSEISLGEIEPIAFVENEFIYQQEVCMHFGFVFAARIRNKQDLDFNNVKGRLIKINDDELNSINRYANREATKICSEYIRKFKTKPLEEEISTNEQYKYRYLVHDLFVKKFILTPRLKKKKQLLEMISQEVGDSKSIVDISCGDSNFIGDICNQKNFDYAVGNDISWSQIKVRQSEGKKILFTNHNASYLPFKENCFDVAFCSNTLHHIPSREELFGLFKSCFSIAKKIIIVEIEKPSDTGLFPGPLNKYWYVGFLKDVGGSFFTKENFQSVVKNFFSGMADIEFKEFRNIQGRYLMAVVTKRIDNSSSAEKQIEVEEKFFLNDKDQLIKRCHNEGYCLSDETIENDEYFTDIGGEFIRNRTCLRLRSGKDKTELTFKGKSRVFSNSYAKVEHNTSIAPSEIGKIKDILLSLGYYKYVTVNKNRITFSKQGEGFMENISIDSLAGIGTFVEFEILGDAGKWLNKKEELKDKLDNLKKKMDAEKLNNANQPYRDYTAEFLAKNILYKGKTKAILFDFDGTIARTELMFYNSFAKMIWRFSGKVIGAEEYIEYELKKSDGLFDHLKLSSFIDKQKFMDFVYEDYREEIKNHSFGDHFNNSIDAIKKIKKLGYKTAIVSSSKKEFVEMIAGAETIKEIFDAGIFRESTKLTKPSAQPYVEAIAQLGVKADDCLAIEDSPRGIKSAREAGAKCALIKGELLQYADGEDKYYFDNLSEIVLILENTNP